MKKLLIQIAFLFTIPSFCVAQEKNTYYVDNTSGNDRNSGKTKNAAWKTLYNLNTTTFEPGEQIFLRRGQVFKGSLSLKGSGQHSKVIKLSAYGTGKRPVINATNNAYGIQLLDAEYWAISDIETTGSAKAGIFIGCTKDNLVLDHFRITNCNVHHIGTDVIEDWDLSQLTGDIIITNGLIEKGLRKTYNSTINDAIIDGCIVRYIKQWNCISISSGKINNTRGNANYVKNCIAEYSVADGIRMNGVKNSFIEYSTMYKNGAWPKSPNPDWGGLGAWFFESDSCTIQFCEASYIDNWQNDGGAFDIDYNQTNSTIQYCYGHDCHGYGASIFGADSSHPTINSTVRYNIFANNARDSAYAYQGDIYVFTWGGGLLNGVKVHNNIYWMADGRNPEWIYRNEKYYSLSDWQKGSGQDLNSKYTDPMMNEPTNHKRGIPTNQFKLKPGSPAINTGVDIGDMGKWDFYGNAIPDKSGLYDIGAAELNVTAKNNKAQNIIKPGIKAPGFELDAVNKEKVKYSDYSGNTILISFINTHNSLHADSEQAMRSQLTFIKSMKKQYAEKGLKIILIDAIPFSFGVGRGLRSDETLINFIHDN